MKKILVIDDDEQLRALLSQILERAGYTVCEAANGADGLKLYRQESADLVITDLNMPQKEGLETILELRRDFPHVPIVAMSGGGRGGQGNFLSAAKKLGVQEVVEKPFSRDEILHLVREVVGS